MDPLAASVHKLANLVYGDRSHLAAAAIPCALSGVGVRLYKDYIAELKVSPWLRMQSVVDAIALLQSGQPSIISYRFTCSLSSAVYKVRHRNLAGCLSMCELLHQHLSV